MRRDEKQRLAVIGAGGVGGYIGACLARMGYDTAVVARGAHLQAIQQSGLRVESPAGRFVVQPLASDNPADIGPVDFVIVAVKLWDTGAAGQACRPLLHDDTAVLSLQNGVDAEPILSDILGARHVLGGVAEIFASIAEPGLIRCQSAFARVRFGELDGRETARARQLADALSRSGIEVEICDNVHIAIWSKFILLAAMSAMTALTRKPVGPIREDPDTRALLRQLMEEAARLAAARGVPLPSDIVDERMRFIDGLPADFQTSMAIDLARGNRLELDWLSGAVVRIGNELGIDTPASRFVCAALALYKGGKG